jgi:MFS_1 like family
MMSDEQSDVAATSLQEPLLLPSPDVVALQQQSPREAATPVTGNDLSEGTQHQYQHRIVDGLTWDRSLLVKSLYFLDALGSSTWGRFSAIYYNLHGLNSQQIGMIEGLCTAIPMLSMVLWGIVSDHYHCRKQVWIGTKTVSTCILLLLALPYVFESFRRILGKKMSLCLLEQMIEGESLLQASLFFVCMCSGFYFGPALCFERDS